MECVVCKQQHRGATKCKIPQVITGGAVGVERFGVMDTIDVVGPNNHHEVIVELKNVTLVHQDATKRNQHDGRATDQEWKDAWTTINTDQKEYTYDGVMNGMLNNKILTNNIPINKTTMIGTDPIETKEEIKTIHTASEIKEDKQKTHLSYKQSSGAFQKFAEFNRLHL